MNEILSFVETGGSTMSAIFAASLILWIVIVERAWYLYLEFPSVSRRLASELAQLEPGHAWNSARVERGLSQARQLAESRLWLMKTMVVLCPLLGLLGTVVGMLEIFDVIAVAGNGNPRALAGGVSQAILTTLAGMAAALSGLFFVERLQRTVRNKMLSLEESVHRGLHHG